MPRKGCLYMWEARSVAVSEEFGAMLEAFLPHSKKKDSASSAPPSPEAVKRQQLQEGFFVLRLRSKPTEEHSARDLWMHMGYINFTSWDFACLQLHWAHEQPQRLDEQRLTAIPGENPDEDLCLA